MPIVPDPWMVSWVFSTCVQVVHPIAPPARVTVPPPVKVTFAAPIYNPLPALEEFMVICPALLIAVPNINRLSPSLKLRLSSLSMVKLLIVLTMSSVTGEALELPPSIATSGRGFWLFGGHGGLGAQGLGVHIFALLQFPAPPVQVIWPKANCGKAPPAIKEANTSNSLKLRAR